MHLSVNRTCWLCAESSKYYSTSLGQSVIIYLYDLALLLLQHDTAPHTTFIKCVCADGFSLNTGWIKIACFRPPNNSGRAETTTKNSNTRASYTSTEQKKYMANYKMPTTQGEICFVKQFYSAYYMHTLGCCALYLPLSRSLTHCVPGLAYLSERTLCTGRFCK